jgi:hypothetical protein
LRAHLDLCRELLALAERENLALRAAEAFPSTEFQEARKSLIPRLDRSYKALKEVRIFWQQLDAVERLRHASIALLVRQTQDVLMKILLLDRQNEQAMLRRGLLSSSQLPSAHRQRPHFVADLYRRSTPT